MRPGPLCVLLAVLAMGIDVQAEESNGSGITLPLPTAAAQVIDLQQRLKDSERQREELQKQLQSADANRESALLKELRLENQKLRTQLKEAQTSLPLRFLTEQQQWFVTGGGVALIALLCGIFATRGRRARRQWLN
ncbi:translation initiation factor 2 [Pseudomonas sp. Pseusp122]|uniref:translation initiation factor 2 n=1 Tax=unclassified Pseudomonas TaxID=196821 RepID=UPI0039A499F9